MVGARAPFTVLFLLGGQAPRLKSAVFSELKTRVAAGRGFATLGSLRQVFL